MIKRIMGGLMLALSACSAQASPMLVAASSHFQIFSAQSEPQLKLFADQLERYDALLRDITGIKDDDPGTPLTIYAARIPAT